MSDTEVIETYRNLRRLGDIPDYSRKKTVECRDKISCSRQHKNIYLFDYRSKISETIEKQN